jgi:hypothetical protein
VVQAMIDRIPTTRPFNSPLECGLRLLFILAAAKGDPLDLQRLVSYDYLLVHSGDVVGGPPSLHPPMPFRGAEFLIKRDLVQLGLNQMFSRELLIKTFDMQGINYRSTQLTAGFLDLMRTEYANALPERAAWVIAKFQSYDDRKLEVYMTENLGRWGAELNRLTAISALEL